MNDNKKTTVEVAVYGPGPFATQLQRVVLAANDDATLNDNLRGLRQLWAKIEEDLGERGLV